MSNHDDDDENEQQIIEKSSFLRSADQISDKKYYLCFFCKFICNLVFLFSLLSSHDSRVLSSLMPRLRVPST